jgi:hypothetical protein
MIAHTRVKNQSSKMIKRNNWIVFACGCAALTYWLIYTRGRDYIDDGAIFDALIAFYGLYLAGSVLQAIPRPTNILAYAFGLLPVTLAISGLPARIELPSALLLHSSVAWEVIFALNFCWNLGFSIFSGWVLSILPATPKMGYKGIIISVIVACGIPLLFWFSELSIRAITLS